MLYCATFYCKNAMFTMKYRLCDLMYMLWIVTLTIDWKFYITECLRDQETRLFCSKGVKIVWDSSTVFERVMCDICNASLMSQAYLDRHMKWNQCNFLICCISLNFGNVTIEENHGIYCSQDACDCFYYSVSKKKSYCDCLCLLKSLLI